MTNSKRDQLLLASFPRPPPGLLSPSGPNSGKVPSPKPSPNSVYKPSDFGFIQVVLDTDSDADSLYDDPSPRKGPYFHHPPPVPTAGHREPNLGDLRLVLDSPSKVFAPNETITGYISGWDSSSHIHIILEGRANTYIRTDKAEYKDRTPLIYRISHLPPERQGIVPRFSITIPEKTQYNLQHLDDLTSNNCLFDNYWTHGWPAQEPYESQPNRPIPPSTHVPLRGSSSLSSRAAGSADITYRLIAIRSRPSPTSPHTLTPEATNITPLTITTLRFPQSKLTTLLSSPPHSTTRDLSLQTRHLSLPPTKRTSLYNHLLDSLHTTSASSSTPTFYFAPTITTPRVAHAGSPLQIKLRIAVLPPPPGKLYNFPIPDIQVVDFKCRIRSYTGIRVLRRTPSQPPKSVTVQSTVLHTTTTHSATFTPRNGAYEGQNCVFSVTLPASASSSFKSASMWRGYKVDVDVGFRVAGRGVRVRGAGGDLDVVAGEGDFGVRAGGEEMGQGGDDGVEMARVVVLRGSDGGGGGFGDLEVGG
ncbi:hypothetical protein BU24DRAFT_492694 [Aaosphaeria arxii CBS 175.79]|uniref:Arrestin-like N-terminal domain-containing protein n=1 Tax=Aaosphaeria arxii CBS 175.79 TaxID=1450172 RepID=A0A6A5XVI1_9PLEO|nr:uncharacterized protein BU24DRAFT_492694 [Aaosphaeria arxii CBS 175.79]KAF2016640.1 hypothetical protein BU24DRAFT_492694 [Aaosphaeria arxii CBS 175.79]